MRTQLPLAAGLLVLAACSRELSVPEKQTLAVSPTFTSVSPREAVAFAASGGAGSRTFAFAEGGRLSGPDATIDAATGAYRAGRLGSALDVVVVTDAAGRTATATVSVGPRLVVTPIAAGVAPGGSLFFVGTGGKAPYTFALSSAPSGGTIDPGTGLYRAGPSGDVDDEVLVSDQTGDASAAATAVVRVSSAVRLYRGTTGAVAPLETVVFTAFGGQPPYRFEMAASPSGGTIGAFTGLYQAGPRGGRTDRVRVLDAFDQGHEMDVAVGAALSLAPPAGELRPGATVRLVASGGKAPYAFAFESLSNRSGGTLEPATADYTPGPNTGAVDVVAAVDAVGAVTTLRLAPLGPRVFGAGTRVTRCLAAELNGDGRDDAVLLDFYGSGTFRQLTTLSFPLGTSMAVEPGWIDPARGDDVATVGDFAGTGRDQVAFFGEKGFWTLAPDAAGNLTFGPSLPAAGFFPSGSVPGRRYGIAHATVAGATRFYTGATCTVPSNGIFRFDWPTGASAPAPTPTCEPLAWTSPPMHLAATDMNGDGRADLLWTEYNAAANTSNGPVRFAAGLAGGGFGAPVDLAFQTAGAIGNWDLSVAETARGVFFARTEGVSFLLRGTGGANPSWATGDWPYYPGGLLSRVDGIATRGFAADRIVAWDPYGAFVGVDVVGSSPSTVTVLPGAGTLADFVSCGVFPDLDGDGVEDAIASMYDQAESYVFFGDGDGRFGTRFRFTVDGPTASAGADVTGDGVPDLLAATSTPGLRVLAGGEHLLAYGPEKGAPAPLGAVAGGRVGPGGASGVAAIDQSGRLFVAGAGGGAVGALSSPVSMNRGLTTVELLLVANRGSADPRDDVFLVTRQGNESWGYDYIVDELLLGSPSTHVVGPFVTSPFRCAFLPVGTSDVASACTTDRRDVVLGRSTRSGSSLPDFTPQVTYPGSGGTRASMAAAGRLADGTAVLVVAPSTTAAISATAVAIAPPFAVTTSALAGITQPVTGAALGDLDGDGTADLVVLSGSRLFGYRGSAASPGTFGALLTSVEIAGSAPAVVALGGGAAGDVVVTSGDQLVVLRNDGTGALR